MPKVEQWMKDAAKAIRQAALDSRTYQMQEIIERIIASHAPSEPSCVVCGALLLPPSEPPHCEDCQLVDGEAPSREEIGATWKRYWCCTADFGKHEPTCHNYKVGATPASVSSDESMNVISSAHAGDSPKGQRQEFGDDVARQGLINLLGHAVYRNHDYSPDGCAGCAQIRDLIAKEGSQ